MICPKCKEKLRLNGRSFTCVNHHNYDIAKQGYVNLMLASSQSSGDSKEMVVARHRFLNQGYYAKLREKCCELIANAHAIRLVDLGCGEGYYTKEMAKLVHECIGIDLSKDALKMASRDDKKSQYILASIFHLPISSNSVDVITNIFAPTPLDECRRVLKENGIYIRVSPHVSHLYEFKKALYENVYENEVEWLDENTFKLVDEILVEDKITLTNHEDIEDLFMMTPYYWKSSKETSRKVLNLNEITTTIAFEIQVYKKVKDQG